MKRFLTLLCASLLLCFGAPVYGQTNPCSEAEIFSLLLGIDLTDISYSTLDDQNLINLLGLVNNPSGGIGRFRTQHELEPWIGVDLGKSMHLNNFRVWYPNEEGYVLNDYYLLASDLPFPDVSLEALLASEEIAKFHVLSNAISGSSFLLDGFKGRYIRLQRSGYGVLDLLGIDIPGYGENCGNGEDDDCDGMIDCDDSDCAPRIINIESFPPSCPICVDGKITVQATQNDVEYSIDGGTSYVSFNPISPTSSIHVFENLTEDEYEITVRNEICDATNSQNIILLAPLGNPQGDCFNGGFEEGTFEGWNGGIATYGDSHSTINFDNLTIDLNNQHTIVPTASLPFSTDPNGINGNYPALGTYAVRIGNNLPGAEVARLTYCFTVDNDNADFHFLYALAMEDPKNHSDSQIPFFQYTLYSENDPSVVIAEEKTSSNDPFLEKDENDIVYKGWTCAGYDLTNFIGDEICIEFIVADCALGGHRGYAYVDGLCIDIDNIIPSIELRGNSIICNNQTLTVEAIGAGYNQSQWEISKIDGNGNEYDIISLPIEVDYEGVLEDVEKIYESESNYTINCPQDIRVTFIAYNDCTNPVEVTKDFTLVCEEYEVDYCDDLYICNGETEPVILGTNNCGNCEIQWEPSDLLYDDNAIFPTINAVNYDPSFAFNQIYTVDVGTPEGCLYEDEVEIKYIPEHEVSFDFNSDIYCSYSLDITVDLEIAMTSEMLTVYLEDINTGEIYNVELKEENNDGKQKIYSSPIIDRIEQTELEIVVEFDLPENCVYGGEFCVSRTAVGLVTATPFYKPWALFRPVGLDPTNEAYAIWDVDIFSPEDSDEFCEGPVFKELSSVYSLDLKIFYEWGGLAFEKKVVADPNGPGLTGAEIGWDGTQNGVPIDDQVLTFFLIVKSCWEVTEGNPNHCDGKLSEGEAQDDLWTYGKEKETLIQGSITKCTGCTSDE